MTAIIGAIRVTDSGMVELVSQDGERATPADTVRAALVVAPVIGDLSVTKAERLRISTNRHVYRTKRRHRK